MAEVSFNLKAPRKVMFPIVVDPFYALTCTGHILIDKVVDDDNYIVTMSLSHPKEIELREKVELYQTNVKRLYVPPSEVRYESFCKMKDCEFTFGIVYTLGEVSTIVRFMGELKTGGGFSKVLLGSIDFKDFFTHIWSSHMKDTLEHLAKVYQKGEKGVPQEEKKINLISLINDIKSSKKTAVITGYTKSSYFAIVMDEGEIAYAKYIEGNETKKGLDAVFKAFEVADKAEINVSFSNV